MNPDSAEAYQKLRAHFRQAALLSSAGAALGWDQETYLPERGVAHRAEQLAYLSGLIHKLGTAPEVGDWLAACESTTAVNALGEAESAAVREWRRDFDRAVKLPDALVEEISRTSSLGREAWAKARSASDFGLFKPWLEKQVELARRQADCWGFEETPYDALLDVYEPGSRSREIAASFAELKNTLRELLPLARERTAAADPRRLEGDYPLPAQEAFNRSVVEALGFDFSAGRIDATVHPFCTSLGPRDCRLTTRYDTRDFTRSLFGTIHEAGHGMYDQGLPEEAFGSPLGEAVSLGIHESQSRLWENNVGRSALFWRHWYPKAQECFPALRGLPMEEFWLVVNRVEPSFIRVDADEVTYHLHVMLRFEVEKRLIEGTLKAGEVPAAWNELFEHLFGLKVPDDARGCLQDIHWSGGAFGYFPTYTLGTMNAAQLYQAALSQTPGLEASLASGDYSGLLSWLREKVHRHGRRHTPGELMLRATGEPPSARAFAGYLRTKFEQD